MFFSFAVIYTGKQAKSKGAISMVFIPVKSVCNYKKFKSSAYFQSIFP